MVNEKILMVLDKDVTSEYITECGYFLHRIFWDYDNHRVTISLPLTFSIFSKLIDSIFNNERSIELWFQDQNETDYELYNTTYIENAKITKIRVLNSTWGDIPWFVPSCNIQFQFSEIEKIEKDLFNIQINRDYQDFYSKGGQNELSLLSNDKIIIFENFEFNVAFDNNLFPFEFMCCKNTQNKDENENLYQYFIDNKNNLKLNFNISNGIKKSSISFDFCYIDTLLKNQNIPLFAKRFVNTTIYGYPEENFKLSFNNGVLNQSGFISLMEYIKKEPIRQILMRDKNGDIAIEL